MGMTKTVPIGSWRVMLRGMLDDEEHMVKYRARMERVLSEPDVMKFMGLSCSVGPPVVAVSGGDGCNS